MLNQRIRIPRLRLVHHAIRRAVGWLPAFVTAALLIGLIGCGSSQSTPGSNARLGVPEESWLDLWSWGNDELVEQMRSNQATLRAQILERLGAPLFFMSIAAVFVAICGTSIAEWARKSLVIRLTLGDSAQKALAATALLFFIFVALSMAFGASDGGAIRLPILIMCAGAAFVFFVRVLPTMTAGSAAERKVALAQLKPLLFLIVIVLVASQMLAARGLAGLRVTSGG